MEKEWKNGGVSGMEESTECRRDRTCLLRQFIAISWSLNSLLGNVSLRIKFATAYAFIIVDTNTHFTPVAAKPDA